MAKRGENIRKRKDGRWEGRYIKGRKSNRTAIWGYIYGHSYNEVKEKLTIKKMEVQQFALNVDNPTFSELSLTWESSIFLGVKSSTAAHYHYTLQHYILPVLGPYRVQALNERILESSLLEIIAPVDQNRKTLGNAMSKECLTLVRRICRYAVHLHIMRPVEIDLRLPTVNSSNTSVLNNMEQKSVCAFVRSSPTPRRLGMLLMMQMGLRIGEVCGLQWGDFDLKLGILKINRTVCRISCGNGHTKVVIQTPKTCTSRREIPIPRQLLVILKKLRGNTSNSTWFLSGNESKPTEPRCYRKSIKAYLKQATVRQVRPHALRHTFATTCLQAGCDVKTLSELLGHANANITLQRYVHSDLTRKRREMNRIFSHQVSMRGGKAINAME